VFEAVESAALSGEPLVTSGWMRWGQRTLQRSGRLRTARRSCGRRNSERFSTLYRGTRSLTFEGNADGVRIQTFWMPVLGYDAYPKPPTEL